MRTSIALVSAACVGLDTQHSHDTSLGLSILGGAGLVSRAIVARR